MGMPLEMNWMIVTKSDEIKIGDNKYELTKDEYRLYPMEFPIEIRRQKFGPIVAFGRIVSMKWENNQTTIEYIVDSLKTEA